MRWSLLIIVSVFISPIETAYAIPDNESIPEYISSSYLKTTGFIDASYNYLLRSNNFTSKVFDRSNDIQQNGFTLQQLTFTLKKEPDQGLGEVATFMLGRDAYQNAPNGMDPNAFGMNDFGLAVPQAFLRYKNNSDTIKVGMLLSLAGLETYDYSKDLNYSRAIVDSYAQPGTHMGIRGIHKFNDRISVIAGIGNGWNTVKQSYRQTTPELGLSYALHSKFSLMMDVQGGYQYLTDALSRGQTNWRNVFDIFGTIFVTDKLSFAGNYDYGFQTKAALPNGTLARATWRGIAGYVNYMLNDQWRSAIRCEVFEDPEGYRTGIKQNWREITLTIGYEPIKHLLIWGETRHDFSNVNAFLNKSGNNTNKNQQSYALNLFYQFI